MARAERDSGVLGVLLGDSEAVESGSAEDPVEGWEALKAMGRGAILTERLPWYLSRVSLSSSS